VAAISVDDFFQDEDRSGLNLPNFIFSFHSIQKRLRNDPCYNLHICSWIFNVRHTTHGSKKPCD